MRQLFLLGTIAVLLSSCGGRVARPQDGGDTLRLKYASLLTLVRHEGYTVATIRNPWKPGKTLHTYVLVPRNSPLPDAAVLPERATMVRTPVERTAVFTTVHCSLLDMLGAERSIAAVADVKYIKLPFVQQGVKAGTIADCGNGMQPVVEKIMEVKPDAILLSPFENSGGYGKVEELDIPVVECAEYMETSPLARAEWMRFYGMLLGRSHEADSLFACVDSSYQSLRAQAAKARATRRRVLFDRMTGSVWYVPGGCSTIGRMVADAGGDYPWSGDTHSGSLSLPFENVLERAGDADVWLYRYSSGRTYTKADLLAEHDGYRMLRAFRQGEVYGCNVERSAFYEETPFRPDLLLSDFILLFHPELGLSAPLRYFEKTL